MIDTCIHFANFLYLFSYLVRDMLWLRVLTCGGLLLGLVFFTCQPSPLYGPSLWHFVFLVINGFQIRSLVLQRRRQRLTEEQDKIGKAAFHDLSREELLTLLTHVTCENRERLGDIRQICHQQLSQDERVMRDLAFAGLSRSELLNLLTRRMWNYLRKRHPGRWRRRQRANRELDPARPDPNGMAGSMPG